MIRKQKRTGIISNSQEDLKLVPWNNGDVVTAEWVEEVKVEEYKDPQGNKRVEETIIDCHHYKINDRYVTGFVIDKENRVFIE